MRQARDVATLDPVELGDHVCWQVGPAEDFRGAARAFTADAALFGDKLLVLGAPLPRPGGDDAHEGLLATVRVEADKATREGFRALRVLARMDRVLFEGAGPEAVVRHELGMDEVAAGSGAILVCAYPHGHFPAGTLRLAAGVHPHWLGAVVDGPAFRLFSAGPPGEWRLSGIVDADGADAFRAALVELLAYETTVRLHCEALQLMDVAGMTALLKAARSLPRRRIVVHGANEAIRRHWSLLGFDADGTPVELVR